jgi:hypothetical protein
MPSDFPSKASAFNVPEQLKEPSTYAGLGIIFGAIASLIATHGADMTSWATLAAGLVAIFKRENSTPKTPS